VAWAEIRLFEDARPRPRVTHGSAGGLPPHTPARLYDMRPRPKKASRTPFVVAAVVTLAAGGATAHAVRRPVAPPERFALWKMRAGGPFAALEEQLWLEQRRKFACRPVVGHNRLCEIASSGQPTTGTPGTVRALVDSTGTVAVVQFRTAIDSSELRLQARAIRDDWKHDVDTLTTRWDGLTAVADRAQLGDRQLWRNEDRTGAAWIEREPYTGQTAALTVADEAALAGVRGGADLGALVLAKEGLDLTRSDAEAQLRHTATLGPAAERTAVPICPPQYRLPQPGTAVRDAHSRAWLSLLERSVPLAYPGTTLHVGNGLSLVRNGIPERLVAEPSSDGLGKPVAVYAMHLPDRAGIAAVREQAGLAAACRVPAELLLVQLDTAGAPLETYRLLLDGEATLSRIESLTILDPESGGPGVHVEYTATYDTPAWVGQIVWSARIQLNEPRVVGRTPAILSKKVKATGQERTALVTVRSAHGDSVRVSFLEGTPGPATTTLVVAQRPGAPLDAYRLLERF
jgi:hypothetical protein